MLDSGSPSVLAQNYRTQETIGSPGLVNNKQVRMMMMMTLMTMTAEEKICNVAFRRRSCCCSCRNGLVRGVQLSYWPFFQLESFPTELKTRMIPEGRRVFPSFPT